MKRMTAVIAVVMCLALLSASAFAAGYDAIQVSIPVSTNEQMQIEITGDGNVKETRSVNGTGSMTVSLDLPGTYHYKISQVPGSDANRTYDKSVYLVTVFVEDLDCKLSAAISADLEGQNKKPDSISFKNEVKKGEQNKPKTGDESGLALWTTVCSLALVASCWFLRKLWREEQLHRESME